MKQIVTTMTQRGQVTVPAEVRRKLGLKARDKVAFKIDDNGVHIEPAKYTLETVFGSVRPLKPIKDIDAAIRQARDEKAVRDQRKLQRS